MFPFEGEKILAVMDRLQFQDGVWTIWDWKTGRKFERETLAASWQTRLYRFALAEAGRIYNDNQPIAPETIRMVYWSAEHDRQEIFPYDAAGHAADAAAVRAVIAELREARDKGFPMTGLPAACHAKGRPCAFVPVCRGAGYSQATDEVWEPDETAPLVDDDNPFV